MRYVIDIDGTICTPGPTDEMRYEQAMPIQDRIDKINKLPPTPEPLPSPQVKSLLASPVFS